MPFLRVATGQGKVREIQGQGKVREFCNWSGKFGILRKVREFWNWSGKFDFLVLRAIMPRCRELEKNVDVKTTVQTHDL